MKKFKLLLPVVLFLFSCAASDKETVFNSLHEGNIKGDVVMTERITYAADSLGHEGPVDSASVNTKKYDEKGRMTETVNSHFNGTVSGIWRRSYHPNGFLHKTEQIRDGRTVDTEEIFIDEKGRYTYGQLLDSSGKMYEYFIVTDQHQNGQLLGWKSYTKDSLYIRQAQDIYENGLPARYIRKDSAGKLIFERVFRRNEKKEIVEVADKRVVNDSVINKVLKYRYARYDEQGNWTRCLEMDENEKPLKIYHWKYSYRDEKNR